MSGVIWFVSGALWFVSGAILTVIAVYPLVSCRANILDRESFVPQSAI